MLKKIAKPEFEDQRLVALQYLDVLDTGPDEGFDRLSRLVRAHFDVPIVLVGFIDEERQWFKSKLGFDRTEIPRETSLCAQTILGDEVVYIPDASVVSDLCGNPLVEGDPNIKFYASVPLAVDGGQKVGTLCMIDTVAREMTGLQLEEFCDFGTCFEQQLIRRRLQSDADFLVSQTSRLNTLLETVADGIVTIDDKGQIESLNTIAAHIFGYEPYEILGENFNKLMPDLGHGGWSEYTNLFFNDNWMARSGEDDELFGRRKNGSLFPMDFSVREMEINGQRLFTGIIRDITDRKIFENELKRGREILEMTKENVPIGITVFDEKLKLSIVNREAERLLDFPKNYLCLGRSFEDIATYLVERGDYGEGGLLDKISSLKKAAFGKKPQRFMRKFGQNNHVEVATRPMPGGGMVSIFSDMTAHFENEAKLEKLLQQANTANQAKSNFLSSISHEIRTPLNGVIGVAQMLGDTDLNQDQQEKLDTILRSGKTLLELINDVLDMSKIETGNLDLEVIVCNLREVITSILQPFELQAEKQGLEFTVFIDPALPLYHYADPTRIRQLVMNLLSNALKFTEEGNVSLSVVVNQDTAQGEQIIQISVEDTGMGIAKDAQGSVFASFSQADTSIARKFGGTGLGLSIVKNLVHLMEGKIDLTSEFGKGSCFFINLPLKIVAEKDIPSIFEVGEIKEAYTFRSLAVLVAEDNEVNAMIAQAFLKKAGHSSKVAKNGKIAIEMLAQETFDLILMDVHMPEMDGIEATKIIRTEERYDALPIIGLTADAFSERHEIFMDIGMIDVLTKPFTEKQLEDILVRHILSTLETVPKGEENHQDGEGNASLNEVTSINQNIFFEVTHGELIGSDEKMQDFLVGLGADVTRTLIEKSPAAIMDELASLREGLKNDDSQIVLRAAHTISGVAGSMCADRLAKQASLIEKKSDELAHIQAVLPEMEKTVEDTIAWWSSKA
ncbi:MAG: ATP-binding protein, partial [Sneathiella sp.]